LNFWKRCSIHDLRIFLQWIADGHCTSYAAGVCLVLLHARCHQGSLGITGPYIARATSHRGLVVLHHCRSIVYSGAQAIDCSKCYRVQQFAEWILLNNAYCSLNHFNGPDVFALFSQRRQIHVGWIRLFIQGKHIDTFHGSWMTLLYVVKQRSEVGSFITIRSLRVLRIVLRTEVFAVLLVLVRTTRGEHHGIRAGLFKRLRVGRHRRQPSKYEACYHAKYSHPTKFTHNLKLRHLISSRTGFEVMLARAPSSFTFTVAKSIGLRSQAASSSE